MASVRIAMGKGTGGQVSPGLRRRACGAPTPRRRGVRRRGLDAASAEVPVRPSTIKAYSRGPLRPETASMRRLSAPLAAPMTALVLLSVALLAAVVPALRGTRVTPTQALRVQ